MKKTYLYSLTTSLLLTTSILCASEETSLGNQLNQLQEEVSSTYYELVYSSTEEKNEVARTYSSDLKESIIKKITRLETKLNEYKSHLKNNDDDYELKYYTRKIKSTEGKIQDLKDSLDLIQLLDKKIAK